MSAVKAGSLTIHSPLRPHIEYTCMGKLRPLLPQLTYAWLCVAEFRLDDAQAANLDAETLVAFSKKEPASLLPLGALLRMNGQTEFAARILPTLPLPSP